MKPGQKITRSKAPGLAVPVAGGARNQGMALLEVLVAIVILALGVLGVLNMQLRTLTDAQTSARRAQAVWLIDDLSERLRSNTNSLLAEIAGNYVTGFDDKLPRPNCANGCPAAQHAAWDIAAWKDNLAQILPDGKAAVFMVRDEAGTAENRRQLGVMVAWREAERTLGGAQGGGIADLRAQFKISAMDANGKKIECPDAMICHLDYIALTARCVPGKEKRLMCASGAITIN
jgi:type IV pilus assembly protein PilV